MFRDRCAAAIGRARREGLEPSSLEIAEADWRDIVGNTPRGLAPDPGRYMGLPYRRAPKAKASRLILATGEALTIDT